jgi:hypothetical protein
MQRGMNVVVQKKNVFSQRQNVPLQSFAHYFNRRKSLDNEMVHAECSAFRSASVGLFCFSNNEMYALIKR